MKKQGIETVVIKEINQLEKLKTAWLNLEWHPNADYDYFLKYVQSKNNVIAPYVLAVHSNGTLKALLVGRIEETDISFNVGYKRVRKTRVKMLAINYGGYMGCQTPDIANAIVCELTRALKNREADVVFLNALRVDSDLYRAAKSVPGMLMRDRVEIKSAHWKMACPENLDAFMKRMSQKHRYWIRRVTKLLEKEYPEKIVYRFYSSKDNVDVLCKDAEEIAKKTYQRALGVGFKDSNFTRSILELLATKGLLRSYFIYVNGKPCAYWIGTLYGSTFHLDYTAYDPAFQKNELGTILFMRMIDDLSKTKVREIDFGFGDALYKNRYGDESWEESSVYIFAPSWKGFILNANRMLAGAIHKLSEKYAKKAGILQEIKTKWRRKVQGQLEQKHKKAEFDNATKEKKDLEKDDVK